MEGVNSLAMGFVPSIDRRRLQGQGTHITIESPPVSLPIQPHPLTNTYNFPSSPMGSVRLGGGPGMILSAPRRTPPVPCARSTRLVWALGCPDRRLKLEGKNSSTPDDHDD
jgi:hypothetical protein